MTINILESFDLKYKPKSLSEHINESFYDKGWNSLESDSTLLLDNTSLSNTVIEILSRMFGQEDIKGLVYCSHDTGLGVDFHTIYHKIHEIKPSESKVVKGYGEVAYVNKFEVNGATIVQINTIDTDGANDSVFVTTEEGKGSINSDGGNKKEENVQQVQTSVEDTK